MEPSRTWIMVTLSILGSEEQMKMPAQTATTCQEVAERLGMKAGASPDDIHFVQKQGSQYRYMFNHEQVARNMTVRGIETFTRPKFRYADPKVIIGAGHIGLRMAMFLNEARDDFVVFDRMFRVGGTSWMYQANSTSKLQTEYGAYHLCYGEEFAIPTDFTTPWPSRNALLDHFQRVSEEQGILPHIRLNTNVKSMEVIERGKEVPPPYRIERYELTIERMEAGRLRYGKVVAPSLEEDSGAQETFNCCSICMFPGNLTLPRQETYKGEDIFDGDIGYAMFNEIDYQKVEGENVTIVGHGAFAVENIRTCCEFDVAQIYLVCRRKNLACPRVASWMANRTLHPLSNARFMKVAAPMYDLIGFDPWSYHSVTANEKRTTCQITQKARFGIGDIYFLALHTGKCELIEDPLGVKRLTRHEVHLASGRKLPCKALLKLLGLVGEMDNDRLLRIKEMIGFWVDGDPRRYIVAEPVSVMCSQMGGTSLSPGAYAWSLEGIHMVNFPHDFIHGALASGMLPKHGVDLSDEGTPRPAYVVDARHGTQTSMTVGMCTPHLQEVEGTSGFIKAVRHRLCHPIKKFLAQAKEDWDHYAHKMIAGGWGADKPYPEYPYTPQVVCGMYAAHREESSEPFMPCDEEDIALCA
uniref:FAD/NAD(P)-binding domain-containing protein n=1 Tax=Alexandrium monilatum TaxID=311494 RepID=A0A7S4T9M2_9DINO